jgi:secondary thiamine-phosphate synthase enzyme
MTTFHVKSTRRTELINITAHVRKAVAALGVANGWVTVYVPHTTAGVTINEQADPDVASDMETVFDRLVPWNGGYRHSEGNTAAHVKATMVGSSVRVPVEGGRLRMGTWQGIWFCEFDGPRSREVWVGEG